MPDTGLYNLLTAPGALTWKTVKVNDIIVNPLTNQIFQFDRQFPREALLIEGKVIRGKFYPFDTDKNIWVPRQAFERKGFYKIGILGGHCKNPSRKERKANGN